MTMDNDTRQLAHLVQRVSSEARDCPDSESMARVAAGEAWPWQRRRVAAHVSKCSHCAAEYRTLLAARDGLRDALGLAPHASSAGNWLRGPAVAGVAAVAVVAIVASIAVTESPEPLDPSSTRVASSGTETIFSSSFGGDVQQGAAGTEAPRPEVLFSSDFDGARNG